MTYKTVLRRTPRTGAAPSGRPLDALRQPGAGDRAGDALRAVLGMLFHESLDDPPPAAAVRRRLGRACIAVAAACAGTIVLLLRIPGLPAWDSLYAEDQAIFLPDALRHPWHLLTAYGGYEQFVPRLVGQLTSYLPLPDIAVASTLFGAGFAALCGLFIYHAMDGHIRSRWLRALLGAALILLPMAPIELADSTVDSPWYALVATFFALIWRPRTWAGMTAAALIAFAAGSSEILAAIYAPLVLLRLVALPRWREHAVTAGWLAGLALQVPAVLASYGNHTQRLGVLATPDRALAFYFHNVVLRALGWRLSLHLVEIFGYNGATVLVGAALAAGLGWGVVTGTRQVRVFITAALLMGFVQTMFAVTVVPYVIFQRATFEFEGGSRYAALPIMGFAAAAVVAVDAYLRRERPGGVRLARPSPRVVAAVAVLTCVLALGWVSDYRYGTEHQPWGPWQVRADRWLAACAHSRSGEISVFYWGDTSVKIPCSRLHR